MYFNPSQVLHLKHSLKVFLFLLLCFPVIATATNVDSLQQVLQQAQTDTARLSVLKQLSSHFAYTELELGITYTEQALRLAEKHDLKKDIALLLNTKGSIYLRKNELIEAMQYYRQAIQLGEQVQLPSIGPSYDNLGLCFSIQRQADSAIVYHRRAIRAARLQKNDQHIGIFVGHLGLVYANMSELDSAKVYFEQALHHLELAGSSHRANIARINLALLLSDQGEHEKALDHYFKSLDYFEQANDYRMLIQSYGSIGLIYHQLQQADKAIEYHQKAIELNANNEIKVNIGTFQLDLANIFLEQGDLEKAKVYLTDARRGFQAIDDQMGIAETNFLEGKIYESEDHLEQAIDLYANALKVFEKYNNSSKISDLLAKMALTYEQLNKRGNISARYLNGEIEQLLLQADSLAQQSKQFDSRRNALLSLVRFYKARKDFPAAFQYQEQFLSLNDSIYNHNRMTLISEMETKYETREKEKENELLQVKTTLVQAQNKRYVVILILLSLLLLGLIYLYQLLRKTKNKLGQSNRTKDQLFAIIAHDLRGATNNFKGIGTIIQYHLQNNNKDRLQTMAQEITHSANKLSDLLDNLLQWSLSNLNDIKTSPSKVSLRAYIDTNKNLLEEYAKTKNIHWDIQLAPDMEVYVDPDSLSLILRNLLSNAIKFSERGGTISLQTTASTGFVNLSIKDTGVGIPPEKLENIFQVDRQKSSLGTAGERGSGIGLSLSKDFLERSGGKLSISSKVGLGTTCVITLPTAE